MSNPHSSCWRGLFGALGAVILAGCTSLDPYGLVARHVSIETSASEAPLDLRTREQAFDFVWQSVHDAYLDAALRGVDWAAVRSEFRPRALAAASDEAFWRELDRMTARLADSHTRVESPQRYREIRERAGVSLGLWVEELDGALHVLRVAAGSEAWLRGVRPGARVLRIGTQPAADWWRTQWHAAREGSTTRTRIGQINRALNGGAAGSVQSLSLARADGSLVDVQLTRRRFVSPRSVSSLRLGDGPAYLRFSDFDERLRGRTLSALAASRDAPGLVLDLRGNNGGSIFFARALLDALLTGEHRLAHVQTRSGKPVSLLFGLIDVLPPELRVRGRDAAPQQPIAVLVDGGSASAAELVAAALQSLGRARLFGEASCGCMLGYLGYANIPGGGMLAYSEFGFRFADGRVVEGRGITPDVELAPCLADLRSGRDAALEAALAWLRKL